MDISDSLSTNSDLDDTMGSILSASNENETQTAENDSPAHITTEEYSLISQNIEVNELPNTTENENLPDTTLDNVESYTEALSEQDINLIIMGKPSTSDDSEQVISSSVKNDLLDVPSTSHIEEHEALWLGDSARQLVKVDTDEDFEVIVKSLETAIVETERYDIDTVITSNDEPVMSSLGISLIESDGDSLLEDIPSNLLTSAVPPLPLQELQGHVRVELSGRILQSPVERPVLQRRNSDNYDEFATISEPKVESFDEQSSSLFDVMEPEIDIPIENEPSLLELQEATMPADISDEFQQDIELQESPIFSSSAAAVENITTKPDELDEICEASVDSEFAENKFITEQIDSDNSSTFNPEVVEDLEKLENVGNLTEREQGITVVTVPKIDAPSADENVIDLKTAELENIFEINSDNIDFEDNIISLPQIGTKVDAEVDAGDDNQNIKTILIAPELSLESTSKIVINSTIEKEENIDQELHITEESTEKQKCIQSKESVQEKQDNTSELAENETDIVCKNISLEEDTKKSEETSNLISLHVGNKPEIIKSTETNIQNEEDKILTKVLQKEAQQEISSTSSESIKHSLDFDEKEQSPPKKIKLVREKFQIKPIHTASRQLQKNVETSTKSEMTTIKKEEKTSTEIVNEIISVEKNTEIDQKIFPIQEKKPDVEGKETIQQILEKLEDSLDKSLNENKSPVKVQKLKLQRNYKLPQKPIKQKVTKKVIEEPATTSTKKIEVEVKNTNIAQDKSIKLSSKVEVEEILQPSLSKTKITPLESKISVVSVESNKAAIIKEVEIKSVEPVLEIEIDHPEKTVSAYKISVSTDNPKIIDVVSESEQHILFSTEQNIPEFIEQECTEKKLLDNQINLEEVQETCTVDSSENLLDDNQVNLEEILQTNNVDLSENVTRDNQIYLEEKQESITVDLPTKATEDKQIKLEEIQETKTVGLSESVKDDNQINLEEIRDSNKVDLSTKVTEDNQVNLEEIQEIRTVDLSENVKDDNQINSEEIQQIKIFDISKNVSELNQINLENVLETNTVDCTENVKEDSQTNLEVVQQTNTVDLSENIQDNQINLEEVQESKSDDLSKNVKDINQIILEEVEETNTVHLSENIQDNQVNLEEVQETETVNFSENVKDDNQINLKHVEETRIFDLSKNVTEDNQANLKEVQEGNTIEVFENTKDDDQIDLEEVQETKTVNLSKNVTEGNQMNLNKIQETNTIGLPKNIQDDNQINLEEIQMTETVDICENVTENIETNLEEVQGLNTIDLSKNIQDDIQINLDEVQEICTVDSSENLKDDNQVNLEEVLETNIVDLYKNVTEDNQINLEEVQETKTRDDNQINLEEVLETETVDISENVAENIETNLEDVQEINTIDFSKNIQDANQINLEEVQETETVDFSENVTENIETKLEEVHEINTVDLSENIQDNSQINLEEVQETKIIDFSENVTENIETNLEEVQEVYTVDISKNTKNDIQISLQKREKTKTVDFSENVTENIQTKLKEGQEINTVDLSENIEDDNKINLEEVHDPNSIRFTEEFSGTENTNLDNQMDLQIEQQADLSQTLINMEIQSTELKIEESSLLKTESLIIEAEPLEKQITNNENESIKNRQPVLIETQVEEKKEDPYLTENEILDSQISLSLVKIPENIEVTSTIENKQESKEIEKISLEKTTDLNIKNIQNIACVATATIVEKIDLEETEEPVIDEVVEEPLTTEEISKETEQIFSSTNIESIVENITDTEIESTVTITERENIVDTIHIERKPNTEIEKILDSQKVEIITENKEIGDAELKTDTKISDELIETKIDNKGLDTKKKHKDDKINIVKKTKDRGSSTKHSEANIYSKNTVEKIEFDKKKVEMKIENKDIRSTKYIAEACKSEETTKGKNIVHGKKSKEKINTETLGFKLEGNKSKSESKSDKLLTFNTQFPLLSSRLQERLEPKSRKFTQDINITPVTFPTVSQESVSKKIQELSENKLFSKQDKLPATTTESNRSEASAFLAKNPEITLTKEIAFSRTDHSATMESATKIKITKRKLESSGSEPMLKRSVTKPLSVLVDDLESSGTSQREQETIPKYVIKTIPKSEGRSSPKITIKPIKPPEETHKRSSEESSHSPKITIKPIVKQDPLKITITKQKADDTHSILKIYQPDDGHDHHIPKLTIKPIPKSDEMQHSPRITIKPVKHSPSTSNMSPKITVKPIPSPNEQVEIIHSPKVTVKPVVNPEESYPKVTIKPVLRPEESHKVSQLSPRLKLKSMTFDSSSGVTVEPICGASSQKLNPETQTSLKISVKPFAKIEESLSPKLTIKPITKTCEIVQSEDGTSNPLKLTIKPILKPEESSYQSPKITIKPIVKPDEMNQQGGEELDKPERIILKIQKNSLPSPKERLKDMKKEPEIKIEAVPHDPEKNQRLDKIKLKLTKEGSHAQIIPSISTISDGSFSLKRSLGLSESGVFEKRSKTDFSGTEILHTSDISINIVEPNAKPCLKTISEEVTIMKIDKVSSGSRAPTTEHQISQSKFKEMLMKIQQKPDITCTPRIGTEPDYSSSDDDVKIVEIIENDPLKDPLSLNDESSSQDVMIVNEVINANPFQNVQIISAQSPVDSNIQTPKKRGRPRKNPLEVKPEIKGEDCVEVRPKRTCRAPPGRTPFAVKERKPRGAGRGRGSRGRGASKSPQKSPKEVKTPRGKALKEAKALAKLEAARLAQEVVIDEITIEDSTNDTPAATPVPPADDSPKKPEVKEIEQTESIEPTETTESIEPAEPTEPTEPTETTEPPPQMVEPEVKISISEEPPKQPPPPAVYEEETRMSADNSRAQTPARQVFTAPLVEGPEESQSSVQSTATTESTKTKKGRLEVCDPDSAVTTVDQIVEYSWANGGPYMLQEQIAQYLGVKSFKRKYPGLTRRPVEMQERDYIREKGLVSESMCDMGLTAVPSSEILDIMYSDFQEKYEEYRKCLRDKQAKEISNKQKAVSLATSQEKNKIDFKERAIRSAANWNVNFNKARKETRKCCMDLQTFTINYPAGKIKVPHKTPVGHYPLALVPGQYTDFYKSYTTNDLRYLPLNTVRYGPVLPNQRCDPGQSDGSQSDSDSSSGSDSDSSDDSMSTEEETQTPATLICKPATVQLTQLTTPKSKIH